MCPCYVPIVGREPVTTRSIRRWSEEVLAEQQSCFEVADWETLCEPHLKDINGLTECITEYITFYIDFIFLAWTVHCYPNNKQWATKNIKALLNDKKRLSERATERRWERFRGKIREAKDSYRRTRHVTKTLERLIVYLLDRVTAMQVDPLWCPGSLITWWRDQNMCIFNIVCPVLCNYWDVYIFCII